MESQSKLFLWKLSAVLGVTESPVQRCTWNKKKSSFLQVQPYLVYLLSFTNVKIARVYLLSKTKQYRHRKYHSNMHSHFHFACWGPQLCSGERHNQGCRSLATPSQSTQVYIHFPNFPKLEVVLTITWKKKKLFLSESPATAHSGERIKKAVSVMKALL